MEFQSGSFFFFYFFSFGIFPAFLFFLFSLSYVNIVFSWKLNLFEMYLIVFFSKTCFDRWFMTMIYSSNHHVTFIEHFSVKIACCWCIWVAVAFWFSRHANMFLHFFILICQATGASLETCVGGWIFALQLKLDMWWVNMVWKKHCFFAAHCIR